MKRDTVSFVYRLSMRTATLALVLVSTVFAQSRSRLVDYALLLEDPPVAQKAQSRLALRSAVAQQHLQHIRDAQAGVLAELKRRKVQVTGANQVLVNAVFVNATRETADQLRSIPGVAHVVAAPPLHMDLNRALDLQNVPAAWSAVGGASNAGAGIKIGIIDSGIDQNHAGFKDASLSPPSGFPKGETAYTNSKVIVARSYVPLDSVGYDYDPAGTTHPDDYSPRDRMGHGTAIAMIAAGVQNIGPQGTIQGVAPKAFLGNYKIIGSPSINPFARVAAFQQALTDALNDGMDIVTLSVSEGNAAFYGPLDVDPDPNGCGGQCDVYAQAIENAIRAGMTVVVSVGNDGNINGGKPTFNTIHTPGTAPSAITVGATGNSHVFYQAVRLSDGTSYRALFGDGPHIASPLTAPVRDVARLGNDGLACSALPTGSLAGAIAVIQRGTCNFSDKINTAQNAGAISVIIYQLSGQDTIFSGLLAQDTGIPAVMIGNADGTALKSFIASNSNATATLDPALVSSELQPNTVWAASSRGPSPGSFANTQTFAIKPELVATGVNIYTATQKLDPNADAYDATGYTSVTGTSYAVPMVAGAVALVKQKNPGFTPAQLKSAVVNTATQDANDEAGVARVNSAGAGKLSAGDAVNVTATLDPPTIEFGAVAAGALPINRVVRITNVGSASTTFTFSVQPRDTSSANVTVTPSSVTLGPAGSNTASNTVTVGLTGTRPAGGSYEGFIVVTGAGPSLRMPYQYLVASGTAAVAFPIGNGGFLGGVNDQGWQLSMRVTDQFGVPVVGTPLLFRVVSGGAKITAGDTQSFRLGNAAAIVTLGPTQGDQIFNATVGSLTVEFDGYARVYPSIAPNRVVDAATGVVGQGLAPGSYISIYGAALADATQVESTAELPVALSDVSVNFDGGGLSLPGRIHFVSPGQINVQVPWEFAGQTSVSMKVTTSFLPSLIYTVPLNQYSPGIFEFSDNGRKSAVAQDLSFALITQNNPAQRGKAIQIYANGLGPTSNQPGSGMPSPGTALASTAATPIVTIGGVQAQVIFSGLTPNTVGLYQVNVIVPANAPTGNQPVVLSVNGINSQPSNLFVQ